MLTDALLAEWVADARARSIALVADLTPEQVRVPYLPTINPPLWELSHAAYFFEVWVLRHGAKQAPVRPDADDLFDSIAIGHEERWRLPVPGLDGTLAYVGEVRDRVLDLIESGELDDPLRRMIAFSVFHEDMHCEALTYGRQTLGYAPPQFERAPLAALEAAPPLGDAEFAGGVLQLGADPNAGFCFDNEKWAHPVRVEPFAMARAAVTEGEFAAFVDDGGYRRQALWSPQGWGWVQSEQAELPLFWRRTDGGYERRAFDRWVPLEAGRTLCHVNWHEADAYCRWAERRLPSEAEWEWAAAHSDHGPKRTYAWGDEAPSDARCSMDWVHAGPVAATALASGDSPAGCRQLIGTVWEWTSTTFEPFPGFVADMYEDYSQLSFSTRKVLRGGCWATRSRLIRNTWRNFYTPQRRDVFAGFRTCAP